MRRWMELLVFRCPGYAGSPCALYTIVDDLRLLPQASRRCDSVLRLIAFLSLEERCARILLRVGQLSVSMLCHSTPLFWASLRIFFVHSLSVYRTSWFGGDFRPSYYLGSASCCSLVTIFPGDIIGQSYGSIELLIQLAEYIACHLPLQPDIMRSFVCLLPFCLILSSSRD
ncbi:hypothetical protein BDQ17DRAFT_849514 [Cyathus striatus]|nr:hypothetical protein BDQ17DRAFT_849514 [Cyathus striatus]